MQESSVEIIARLRAVIEERLADIIETSQPYALLDFPNYDNIGDSAIWLGEIAYLERRGSRPSFVSEIGSFDHGRMTAAIGSGTILLQGGGNFGDLWPEFRPFREDLLNTYPGRPIIQLPQTIKFNSQENIDSTARSIERHGAFKLLVRDQRSFQFAQRWFQCETRLCPDMAFCMEPVKRAPPRHALLLNLRDDREIAERYDLSATLALPGTVHSDWPEEDDTFQAKTKRATIVKALITGRLGGRAHMTELLYRERAQQRFDRGIALLSSAEQVITDRMHGHIMCILSDIPHCVLDNSYGKTKGLVEAWNTCNTELANCCGSFEEALEIVLDKKSC